MNVVTNVAFVVVVSVSPTHAHTHTHTLALANAHTPLFANRLLAATFMNFMKSAP